jgi:hypothetical protein
VYSGTEIPRPSLQETQGKGQRVTGATVLGPNVKEAEFLLSFAFLHPDMFVHRKLNKQIRLDNKHIHTRRTKMGEKYFYPIR